MEKIVEPIKMRGERVWRTYTGGRELGRLRDEKESVDDHFPEEWMYSVTRAVNSGREDIIEGICKVDQESDVTLKTLIEEHAEDLLGTTHVENWGNTPGVLIKIIDSEERLTVQVHPDKDKAMRLFHSRFGKTECWHILGIRDDAEKPPCIYLGFREGITKELWIDCFLRQDYAQMLSYLNCIEVVPGETYLVKGGVPHAIGAGCLIMEIQEPTDYTIRVEKVTPSGFRIDEQMCHQGLGFERMFECFDYTGMCLDRVREEYCIKAKILDWNCGKKEELIGYDNTSCFKIQRLIIDDFCELTAEGVFFCFYILEGNGKLKTESNEYILKKHDQFFIPAKIKKICIYKDGKKPIVLLKLYGPK